MRSIVIVLTLLVCCGSATARSDEPVARKWDWEKGGFTNKPLYKAKTYKNTDETCWAEHKSTEVLTLEKARELQKQWAKDGYKSNAESKL